MVNRKNRTKKVKNLDFFINLLLKLSDCKILFISLIALDMVPGHPLAQTNFLNLEQKKKLLLVSLTLINSTNNFKITYTQRKNKFIYAVVSSVSGVAWIVSLVGLVKNNFKLWAVSVKHAMLLNTLVTAFKIYLYAKTLYNKRKRKRSNPPKKV